MRGEAAVGVEADVVREQSAIGVRGRTTDWETVAPVRNLEQKCGPLDGESGSAFDRDVRQSFVVKLRGARGVIRAD